MAEHKTSRITEAIGMDLHDVQGNIVKAYGHYDYWYARYVFFRIDGNSDGSGGREFVVKLLPYLTNAEPWHYEEGDTPEVTTNVAFTFGGLAKLGLPQESLQSFPEEFAMGMKARREILDDDGPSSPEHWDKVWEQPVDIWVSINAKNKAALEARYGQIREFEKSCQGVAIATGHKGASGDNLDFQDGAILVDKNGKPTGNEHFGYRDGISNPYFKGSGLNKAAAVGGGKPTRKSATSAAGWEPLETGEFVLGYRDEADEYPRAPIPRLLSYNGTFMVYRKLHQNVGSFNKYIAELAKHYPEGETVEDREEILKAKLSGRWPNGAPLATFPDKADADRFMERLAAKDAERKEAACKYERTGAAADRDRRNELNQEYYALYQKLTAFDFDSEDLRGGRCPVGSHIRRMNPRGALEFGNEKAFETPGALTNRRRLMRRGLPYGKVEDPARDDGNHGIIFMTIGASIARQFEFVQQQWANYANDFKLGNDKDPLIGNHGSTADGKGTGRMTIEAPDGSDRPPFFCAHLPRFVETRGGDYFFLPSITAVRMIGKGIIDPT